jgi:hypothetical protein
MGSDLFDDERTVEESGVGMKHGRRGTKLKPARTTLRTTPVNNNCAIFDSKAGDRNFRERIIYPKYYFNQLLLWSTSPVLARG